MNNPRPPLSSTCHLQTHQLHSTPLPNFKSCTQIANIYWNHKEVPLITTSRAKRLQGASWESRRVAAKGVENEGESGDTPPPSSPVDVSPWMRGWTPSTAHNESHWLLLIMQLTSGSQFIGDSIPPMCSWCHLLPTKSGGGTFHDKILIFLNMCM